jgi:UDP-N-acetylglucosamine--N-acetylmuramyl-(pentapeptide) pyrophosphoryl-undecaprenol N-acetylglucosamine transferase
MTYKILIAAGGSGGHIYPAMGVAAELIKQDPKIELMFAAGGLDDSPFFDRKAFAWESISSAPLNKKNPFKIMKNCGAIAKGVWQSHRVLSAFKPDLVIGFGSYHIFPILFAAQLKRYPIVLHEQNSKPGKVISLFSKQALITGAYFPTATEALKGKSSLLAMPLRPGFSRNAHTKEDALSYFGLDRTKRTLLVFGGSQGAKFINKTIAPLLAAYSKTDQSFQILHFTGNLIEAEHVALIYANLAHSDLKVIVKPSESRMDLAWRAADLAIVRAGAGTIAEQIEFEVPAIFVPYPHGDGHQDGNADFVVDVLGGGWKMRETDWQETQFLTILSLILEKNSSLLPTKQRNLALYKNNSSRQEFTCIIRNLLKK